MKHARGHTIRVSSLQTSALPSGACAVPIHRRQACIARQQQRDEKPADLALQVATLEVSQALLTLSETARAPRAIACYRRHPRRRPEATHRSDRARGRQSRR